MGFSRDKKRGDWIYQFYHLGKLYSSRGFQTKTEARIAREKKREEVRKFGYLTVETRTVMAFSEVANLYLDWAAKRFVKKTFDYKKMVLGLFIKQAGDLPIDAISLYDIHAYLNTRPTNHNYNVHRKELSALFTYAIDQLEIFITNPCKKLEKMPVTHKAKQIPSQEEILRILAAAGPQDRPLLMVLIHTLARIDEILRLTWEDVNFTQETIRLWTRKTKDGSMDYDFIPMNLDLKKTLWAMWQKRIQDHWIFFNEKTGDRYKRRPKFMYGLCKRAGVRFYGFHAIRHFMASYMVDELKVGKKTISVILRHKSLATTEIYLHSIEDSKKIAMEKLSGFGIDFGIDFDEKETGKSIPDGNVPLEIIGKNE